MAELICERAVIVHTSPTRGHRDLGGHSYPSTVAVMGGRFLVPLSAENRAAAGLAAGDEVEMELVLDTAPRELVVPDDLADATRQRRIAKAVDDLLAGKK